MRTSDLAKAKNGEGIARVAGSRGRERVFMSNEAQRIFDDFVCDESHGLDDDDSALGRSQRASTDTDEPGATTDDEGELSEAEGYPAQIAELDPAARPLAFRRACMLLALGHKKSRALAMAAAFAEEWLEQGKPGNYAGLDAAYYLVCEYDAWLVLRHDRQEPTHAFDRFDEALKCAHEITAKSGEALYVCDADGMLIAKYEGRGPAWDQRRTIHVMPYEGGWGLGKPDVGHMLACFHDRKDAVASARSLAEREEATLVVHYRSGDLQRMVYGLEVPACLSI